MPTGFYGVLDPREFEIEFCHSFAMHDVRFNVNDKSNLFHITLLMLLCLKKPSVTKSVVLRYSTNFQLHSIQYNKPKG